MRKPTAKTAYEISLGLVGSEMCIRDSAYGAAGLRCDRREDLDDTIRQALAIDDRPVIVDFVVSRDAMVWPMVPAGVSNDAIQVARGMTPDWDQED